MVPRVRILYKLTNRRGRTYGGCQWGEGVEHTASGEGELCGPGYLHAYTHPLMASLMNMAHGQYRCPLLWESRGCVGKNDHGLKVGCTWLRTIKRLPMPQISTKQRVRFAILCALAAGGCKRSWRRWAKQWLSGEDRTAKSARRNCFLHPPSSVPPSHWAALAALDFAENLPTASISALAALAAESAAFGQKPLDLIHLAEEAVKE